MKNLLILIDFSESSSHAARYAAYLTSRLTAFRMVLYHSEESATPVTEVLLSEALNNENLNQESYRQLTELKNELLPSAFAGTIIDIHVSNVPLVEDFHSFVREEHIDLIVMGTSGKGKMERALIGSNTTKIVQSSPVAVLVVPPMTVFQPVRTVAFASDLKRVKESTPFSRIIGIASLLGARLLVFNVSRENEEVNREVIKEQQDFFDIWSRKGIEYYYVVHDDVAEGIMTFAREHDVQLVVLLHREQSFFDSFFGRGVSHQLAYHTTLPLLILPNSV